MKLQDQLRFVRQNMKRNKTRLFMTVLATAMGCAFLIVLASVGFGLQKSVVESMIGDRLVTAIDIYGKNGNDHEQTEITKEDLAYFGTLPGVKTVTYRNWIGQDLNPRVKDTQVNIERTQQVDFEAEGLAGFKLSAGRLPQNGNEIVVGYHIRKEADQEGASAEALDAAEWLNERMALDVSYFENGKKKVKTIEAVIVGVTEKPTKEWKVDQTIYMGIDTLKQIESITGTQSGEMPYFEGEPTAEQLESLLAELPKPSDERRYNGVQVIATSAAEVKDIAETIREKGYMNYSIADELKQVNLMFMIMKIGLIFVGTIAVLIASIGIFNTMTMAVTERAGDIGIMKAIGAHPSVIRKIFLLESAIIGLLGAVMGTVVSYIISIVVNAGLPVLIQTLMEEEMPEGFLFSVIPPYLAALSCAIALGVAMLSGYRPANRATRIDVLRALRRDM